MRTPLLAALIAIGLHGAGLVSRAQQPPAVWPVLTPAADRTPLPGTEPLPGGQDFADEMISAADALLLRLIDESVEKRAPRWKRDLASPEAYSASVEPNRQRLAARLGVARDARAPNVAFEYVSPLAGQPLARYPHGDLWWVRWSAFGQVHGEGLLLEPKSYQGVNLIGVSDADHSLESIAREFANPRSEEAAMARFFASQGCRFLVPLLIDRSENSHRLSQREWLHRPAFELGRTLAGYEVTKILAAVDAMEGTREGSHTGILGWGEGGRLALYAGALDQRLKSVCVAGYFGSRQRVWEEPADHNVSGLLREFGDAEIASLIVPRKVVINHGSFPSYGYRLAADGRPECLTGRASKPGKPGLFHAPGPAESLAEAERLRGFVEGLSPEPVVAYHAEAPDRRLSAESLRAWLEGLGVALPDALPGPEGSESFLERVPQGWMAARHAAQVVELESHNQWALRDSERLRDEWMQKVKTDSVEAFEKDIVPHRQRFRDDVIGDLGVAKVAAAPRTRRFQEGAGVVSYEIRLEVSPGWFAYGILTVPETLDLAGAEKRPVIVCQHGLEGRPGHVVGEEGFKSYAAFATVLAQRGYVTFAPQNPYIFHDRFRTLQFKAQALGCSLFSLMVPQHEQIVGWLASLPFVDAERIAFYGLSYGGKSAMRLPALVEGYCLSICSADFNEWVWKNAATDARSLRYSYANKGEYEIFEWDLGGTFNYAEMAALICPRPFMVERGHFDGVAPDETVGYEFAKVRYLYQARLGIGDRAEIEWFAGPHTIHGEGSYRFLDRHLNWTPR